MFRELLPVLQGRPLTFTAVHLGDGKIRVCVIPHSQKKDTDINEKVGHRKDVPKISVEALKALTTPLAIEGTAEEVDAELPQQLTTYAEVHRTLQDGIDDATRRIKEALSTIEEREKKERENKKSNTKAAPEKSANSTKDHGAASAEKQPAEATLPLSWCVQSATAPVSANDLTPQAPKEGGEK